MDEDEDPRMGAKVEGDPESWNIPAMQLRFNIFRAFLEFSGVADERVLEQSKEVWKWVETGN